jgi:hypothetical protein
MAKHVRVWMECALQLCNVTVGAVDIQLDELTNVVEILQVSGHGHLRSGVLMHIAGASG